MPAVRSAVAGPRARAGAGLQASPWQWQSWPTASVPSNQSEMSTEVSRPITAHLVRPAAGALVRVEEAAVPHRHLALVLGEPGHYGVVVNFQIQLGQPSVNPPDLCFKWGGLQPCRQLCL